MHICLFGGAFDPPHLGHKQVAESLIEKKICDQVWFVPVNRHPFGKKQLQNEQSLHQDHRVKMLELIMEPGMKVERFELDQPEVSYSYLTLTRLSKKLPQDRFSWVIGSDNLQHFHQWKWAAEILSAYHVYVYPRSGFGFGQIQSGMTALRHFAQVSVSSTQIRTLLLQAKSIAGLVDDRVEEYIRAKRLYG